MRQHARLQMMVSTLGGSDTNVSIDEVTWKVCVRSVRQVECENADVIAAESGVPPSVISGLTSGRAKQVAFKTLNRLCVYFKVGLTDILWSLSSSRDGLGQEAAPQ